MLRPAVDQLAGSPAQLCTAIPPLRSSKSRKPCVYSPIIPIRECRANIMSRVPCLLTYLLLLGTAMAHKHSREQHRHHHEDKLHQENQDAGEGPPFYKGKDGPQFETLKEWGEFAVRRYAPSIWVAVCVEDARHEDGVMRASALLMDYLRGENEKGKELWGGTPWAHHVSLAPPHVDAWSAMAKNESSVECVHASVCVAYYLPDKYQGDKKPPRPTSEEVRVVRVPKWIAYVSQFDGFPSKFRMIFHYMRMVNLLKIHHVPFNWRVAISFVYDPPFVVEDRHNEVLVPARRLDQLFGQNAQDLFADEKQVLQVKTTAVAGTSEEVEDPYEYLLQSIIASSNTKEQA